MLKLKEIDGCEYIYVLEQDIEKELIRVFDEVKLIEAKLAEEEAIVLPFTK